MANKKKECVRNRSLGLASLSPIHCAVEFKSKSLLSSDTKSGEREKLRLRPALFNVLCYFDFFSTLGSYLKWLSKLLSEEK